MFAGRYFTANFFAPRYFQRKTGAKKGRFVYAIGGHELAGGVTTKKKASAFSEHREVEKDRKRREQEELTELVLFLDMV